VTPSYHEFFGLSREEREAQDGWISFVHPDDLEMVQAALEPLLREPDTRLLTFRVYRRDGECRWFQHFGRSLWDEREQRVTRLLVSAQDVTELKQVEEALYQERTLLRTLIDNLPDFIYAKDTESRFVINNLAHARALGAATPAEVVGKTDLDLFPKELAEQYYADEQAILRAGQAILEKEEIVEDQTTGNRLWVSVTKVPLRDQQGNITGLVGISRDITERKRAEEETQHHVQRLTALRNIDLAITTNLQSQAVLAVLLEQVTTQLGVDAADVLLLNSQSQRLEYAAGRGLRTQAVTQLRLPLHKSHAGRAVLEQHIVNVPNLPQDPGAPERAQLLLNEGFITYYGIPLVAKGRMEGVLEIFHRAPLEPDPDWLEFLEALSAQAAIALENARLFEETQEQAGQLEQILDTVPEGVLLLDAGRRLIRANPTARQYLNILTQEEVGERLTHLAGRSLEELLQPLADGLGYELEVSGPPH